MSENRQKVMSILRYVAHGDRRLSDRPPEMTPSGIWLAFKKSYPELVTAWTRPLEVTISQMYPEWKKYDLRKARRIGRKLRRKARRSRH